MRSILGWILLSGGLVVAAIGFCDAGAAWWDQYRVQPFGAEGESLVLPSGFTAKLSIPRLDAALYVVDVKRARDLRRGPGYITGSAKPGQQGNCIIAGHRDLHFRILKDIRVGDEIDIQTQQGRFKYRVSSADVVNATNRDSLRGVYPQQLTLVTCFPFYYIGTAPQRFVVRAYRLQQS